MANEPLTSSQRQLLEARHTWQRLVELRVEPVRGNFDEAHLKENNRRIFQDLPDLGFIDVTPGQIAPLFLTVTTGSKPASWKRWGFVQQLHTLLWTPNPAAAWPRRWQMWTPVGCQNSAKQRSSPPLASSTAR